MSQPTLEKTESEVDTTSADYRAEFASYQNRAVLGMILGILSIPLSIACVFPIGLFAFFLGVQAQAGMIKLGVEQGQKRAAIARVCGGIGSVLFIIRLIVYLLQLNRII